MKTFSLLLLFVLPAFADDKPAAFDAKDAYRTAEWLELKRSTVKSSASNEAAFERQVAALKKEISALTGKHVEWIIEISRVAKNGEDRSWLYGRVRSFSDVVLHSAEEPKINTGDKDTAFSVPNNEFVESLRKESKAVICGTIKTFAVNVSLPSSGSNNFFYEIHLTNCTAKKPPEKKD
jgi:hypothetical protein